MKRFLKFLALTVPLLVFLGLSFAFAIIGAILYYVFYFAVAFWMWNFHKAESFQAAAGNIPMITYSYLEIIIFIGSILTAVLFFFWYRRLVRTEASPGIKLFTIKNILLLALTGLGCQLAIIGLMELVLPHFEKLSESYEELMEQFMTGNPILIFISTVILAPVSEELIFRGVIMKKASRIAPFAAANVIQALLFGAAHMNIVQGVYAFGGGLVMGYVAYKYKTVKASIILHMFFNGVSYFMVGPATGAMKAVYVIAGAVLVLLALSQVRRVKEMPQAL
jgi:membrane protease YdiL (CAAX protease family)